MFSVLTSEADELISSVFYLPFICTRTLGGEEVTVFESECWVI